MGETSYFSSAEILDFTATYSICSNCFSVQVDNPVWIERAHSKAISNLDTGLVSRCLSASRLTSTLLFLEGKKRTKGIGVEVQAFLHDCYGIRVFKYAVTINMQRLSMLKVLKHHSKKRKNRPHSSPQSSALNI